MKFCCDMVSIVEYVWFIGGKVNEGGLGVLMFMCILGLLDSLIFCWYESIDFFGIFLNL